MNFKFFKSINSLYHRILRFFFDFDVSIYATAKTVVPVNKIKDFEKFENVKNIKLSLPEFNTNVIQNQKPAMVVHKVPTFKNELVIHDMNEEFYQMLKIKDVRTDFICLCKTPSVNLADNMGINDVETGFYFGITNASYDEINISKSVRTVEELLSMEPYVKEFLRSKALRIPVVKYPVSKDNFAEKYLDIMQTKLAIQARCKKYSMVLDNVYDKFPKGLYKTIELGKDNSIQCILDENPHCEEKEFLLAGKRKYGAVKTKCFVPYSELGF